LFQYHQWQANLRILEIKEIKTIPYVPLSHPFVERLIGRIRRVYLDHTLLWNTSDLEQKLKAFQNYYNTHRVHSSPDGNTPVELKAQVQPKPISMISVGKSIVGFFSSFQLLFE